MIENEGKYYLYRHTRLDTGEPFYIGIGTKGERTSNRMSTLYNRAYSKDRRNNIWGHIIAKTDYEIEILLESNNYDFIKQKEIEFIALYGRINNDTGFLTNMTDGGEGNNWESKFNYPSEKHPDLFKKGRFTKHNCEGIANAVKLRLEKDKIKYEGRTYSLKDNESIVILEYKTSENVIVQFKDGNKKRTSINAINQKSLFNPYKKNVKNTGYFGEGCYKSKINNKSTKCYTEWSRMIGIFYNNDGTLKKDSEVCKEWHNFQNFAKWYEENYIEGLTTVFNIFNTNKVVSSENTYMIPLKIANFFKAGYENKKGRYNNYCVTFRSKHIGYFKNRKDSEKAYLDIKNKVFLEELLEYKEILSLNTYNIFNNFKFTNYEL
jgi:hypothetical protein